MLVSSHLLSEVEQTVDRVVIVGAGRLVREGSMAELRSGADGAGTVLVRSPEVARLADVLRADGTPRRPQEAAPLTVTGPTPAEVGQPRLRRRRSNCTSCGPHTSGLEEIYFQLTAGQEQFAAPPAGVTTPEESDPMTRLVRAEWTKLFTTRVWIGLLLGACVMVGRVRRRC